ncbi:MAG: hypothetical protein DCC64_06525 [Planctomycetota bacterium]|nr:MAG: hypothetical protein DCC64_06525 [Planctomycetota bacterium]
MAQATDINAVRKLGAKQRLEWIERIRATIYDEEPAVDPAMVAEMERRFQWARANPEKCLTQEQFDAKMRSSA